MLANLPQYQEQREKVTTVSSFLIVIQSFFFQVHPALKYGTRLHGHFREGETCKPSFCGTGMTCTCNCIYRLTVGWSVAPRARMRKERRLKAWWKRWFLCSTAGKLCRSEQCGHLPSADQILVSNMNKVRIIALYIQYRDGVPDEDRRRLYQHARLNLTEQDAVNALVHLGVRVTRVSIDECCRSLCWV